MPRLAILLAAFTLSSAPALALVGGAAPAPDYARMVVMLVGSRGNSCTGVLVARDLVLTAAHCVAPGAEYKLVTFDAERRPLLRDTVRVERHPQFSQQTFDNHRATADLALVKLAAPVADAAPVALFGGKLAVAPGDAFVVAGYGLARQHDGRSGGTLRAAPLVATGRPGNLQIRLFDPATRNERTGRGACTGDSGAPVFVQDNGRAGVIGVVSWSTGPGNAEGCGGLTGVTPLSLYRPWLVDSARKLGSPLAP
ncbi:MAG: trypsin-like serine protease [Pseudorhodoplanes sp.]|nr:trypsin-like serine protease [Pseudorhodoplanes sp.]